MSISDTLLDELVDVLHETKRAYQRFIDSSGGPIRSEEILIKKINSILERAKSNVRHSN